MYKSSMTVVRYAVGVRLQGGGRSASGINLQTPPVCYVDGQTDR